MAGLDAVIWLVERLERTEINWKIVTGIIPALLELRPGAHKLQLRLGPKGAQGASPEVGFFCLSLGTSGIEFSSEVL